MTMDFKQEGDAIYIIGKSKNDLGSSEYLHKLAGVNLSPAPYFDMDEEFLVQQTALRLIHAQIIQSAHDVADGGLFTALVESAKQRNLGFICTQADMAIRTDAYLFGEAQSRIVVSVKKEHITTFESMLADCPFEKVGEVTASEVMVNAANWGDIAQWKTSYDEALEKIINA
jgi:phosphoribosylformylglycinamidine synthase